MAATPYREMPYDRRRIVGAARRRRIPCVSNLRTPKKTPPGHGLPGAFALPRKVGVEPTFLCSRGQAGCGIGPRYSRSPRASARVPRQLSLRSAFGLRWRIGCLIRIKLKSARNAARSVRKLLASFARFKGFVKILLCQLSVDAAGTVACANARIVMTIATTSSSAASRNAAPGTCHGLFGEMPHANVCV